MRTPIRFSVSKDFLPPHTFPHDARAFGSKRFLEAAKGYYLQQFGGGQVDVEMVKGGLSVTWTPEESRFDPFGYAVELLKRRQHPLAIPILRGLLERAPDDPDILYNLGMAESDLGKLDDAVTHLKALVAKDPSHANGQVALGVAYARAGRTDDAIAVLRDAVAHAHENPWARRNLAAMLGKKGLHEEAEPHMREAVRLDPKDPQSLYGLAHTLVALGGEERVGEADGLLRRAIEIDPDSDLAEICRTERNQIAEQNFRAGAGGSLRMDAVMYCLGAMKTLRDMTPEQMKKVTFEITVLGMKGLDVNDSTQKYTLRSLSGQFSGLHLVSIMYVGMRALDLSVDAGFDLSKEYAEAQNLFGMVGGRKS